MDLGEWETALHDFNFSLSVNATGVHAFFSKGECLLMLGRAAEAAEIFRQGIERFPDSSRLFTEFYQRAQEEAQKSE